MFKFAFKNSKNLGLGVRHLESGEAAVQFREFEAAINEAVDCFVRVLNAEDDCDAVKQKLLENIQFTMTDRHVVNNSFRLLLNELRQKVSTNPQQFSPTIGMCIFD